FNLDATKEKNMTRSQIYRTALIAIAGFLITAVFHTGAFAQANSPQGVRNIVIVHGAWADGSSWSKVIPLLQAKGLNVIAVQNPLTSLADDVAATKRAIALQDGPVLLVGHSYGGVVMTEAGNDPKVVGLVYVAALAPSDGESVASVTKPFPPAPKGRSGGDEGYCHHGPFQARANAVSPERSCRLNRASCGESRECLMSSSSTVSTESRRWFFKMTAFASLGPMEVYHFAVFQTALEGIRKLEGHDSPSFPDIRENLIRGDIMPEPSTFLDK